jgi:peptidyl-prolyl cis-trans isomerase C
MCWKASARNLLIFTVAGLSILVSGCSNLDTGTPTLPSTTDVIEITAADTLEPESTQTPAVTEDPGTPVPLAVEVNGEGISLEVVQAEIARFQMAVGTGLATYTQEDVLNDLIDQVLLAQAANEQGFLIDEAMLEARIRELGRSQQALNAWMMDFGYSEEAFRQTMKRSIAAAWMRDQIIADVPERVEQVHARQILLYNSTEAEIVYDQLESGTEFGTLAAQYDPITLGDLGWFPRGYLNVPELDEVLFSLAPGSYSGVIQTSIGYHVLQVVEKDPNRQLTAETKRVVQVQALADWLLTRRNQSEIIISQP